jgi:hypothetical protein
MTKEFIPATPGTYAIWLDGSAIWDRYVPGQKNFFPHAIDIIKATVAVVGWEKWGTYLSGWGPVLACPHFPNLDAEESGDILLVVMPDGTAFSFCRYVQDGEDSHLIDGYRFKDTYTATEYFRDKWAAWARQQKPGVVKRDEEAHAQYRADHAAEIAAGDALFAEASTPTEAPSPETSATA